MEAQMNNTRLYGKYFAPNKSKKNAFTMYYIGFLFVAIGLILYLFSYPKTLNGQNVTPIIGLCFFGFGFIMLIVSFFVRTVKAEYFVRHNAIVLKRGKYILEIPFEQIAEMRKLDEKKTESTILGLENFESVNLKNKYMNFIPATRGYKVIFENNRFGSFMFLSSLIASVAVNGKVASIDMPGASVEISLKNNDAYFITPLDIDGFIKEVQSISKLKHTV